jgi:hypothetical protein
MRLYAQIVRRAAVDHVLYSGHPQVKLAKIGAEADDWLFKDNKDFNALCDTLGVDPAVIRRRIHAMSEDEARSLRGLDFDDEEISA